MVSDDEFLRHDVKWKPNEPPMMFMWSYVYLKKGLVDEQIVAYTLLCDRQNVYTMACGLLALHFSTLHITDHTARS